MTSICDLHLAAANETWILAHDVMGIGALVVLAVLGYLFHKRHRQWLNPAQNSDIATTACQFGRLQLWLVYWLIVAATIFFFFIYSRMTSTDAQNKPEDRKIVEPQPR